MTVCTGACGTPRVIRPDTVRLVGAAGFEPAFVCSQSRCPAGLGDAPILLPFRRPVAAKPGEVVAEGATSPPPLGNSAETWILA